MRFRRGKKRHSLLYRFLPQQKYPDGIDEYRRQMTIDQQVPTFLTDLRRKSHPDVKV